MKTLTAIWVFMSLSSSAQYVRAKDGETNYKKGFVYVDVHGTKTTLLAFKYRPGESSRLPYAHKEWFARFEQMGVTAYGWTSDPWIDLYTDKAFYDARSHQIVYYDEVNITPKK